MAALFPDRRSYKHFVPVEDVRARFVQLTGDDVSTRTRQKEVAAIRRMALAHALAAEAARAGQWVQNSGLVDPSELSTAAGQLYLRAARQEAQFLRDVPGQSARILRDRLDAALEFLAARRQAIAAAIVRDLPRPEDTTTDPDQLMVDLFNAIRTALQQAGRPNAPALREVERELLTTGWQSEEIHRLVETLVLRETVRLLASVAHGFDEGSTTELEDAARQLAGLEDLVAAHLGGEAADLLGRYSANLEWLGKNSVWRLPVALGVENVPLGNELVRRLLADGKAFLFPSQWEGIREHRITSPDQLNVISMPTGSGKSLLAEMLLILHLWRWTSTETGQKKRVFFVVPSRALAREKMHELQEIFSALPSLQASVCQLTGDLLLNADEALRDYDAIVATPEKFDMVLRVPELRPLVGAVVVDEFHNVRDGARGLRLLTMLSRLRNNPETRGAALHLVSAIVRPSDLKKVVRWVGTEQEVGAKRAKYYRAVDPPIFTRCGIFDFDSQRHETKWRIDYDDGTSLAIPAPASPGKRRWARNQQSKAAAALALALLEDGPTLLFATSASWRWNSSAKSMSCPPVQSAVELAGTLKGPPDWVDAAAQKRLVAGLSRLWGKDHDLVRAAKLGVVAHWGGLPLRGRRLVERAVADRGVALLVATSTLAEGVNMPLTRLVIPKCTFRGEQFSTGFFLNLKGRAGRPFLTEEGEVILVASNDTPRELVEQLRDVTSEDVEHLRSPLSRLAELIAAGRCKDEKGELVPEARELEDALDGAVLAVVCEEEVEESSAAEYLMVRTMIDPIDVHGHVAYALRESVARLHEWSLVETVDEALTATVRGASVYRSGFSPRDAARTREAIEREALLPELLDLLPDGPFGGSAYEAIVILMRLLQNTGSWAQLTRAGVRSSKQAALFLLDWVRGNTIEEISETRSSDRLYLHSMLEGGLGPTAAWFLFSLSAWLEDDSSRERTAVVIERLEKWAEFAWFGAPSGNALDLLKRDFQGVWYRDDAIRVCRALSFQEVRGLLEGTLRLRQEDLERRIQVEVPNTVESAASIASALLASSTIGA